MVNISKKTLSSDKMKIINRLFYEVSSFFQSFERFDQFTNEIFTKEEKIIFIKRVAVIYLLTKKMDQRSIASSLNISLETVSKFALIYANKETEIVKTIRALIAKEKLLSFMKDILSIFFYPSIYSTGRYARRRYEEEKRKKQVIGL